MVADDQVDPLLARGVTAPLRELALVRNDAALEPVMDREDAVVGRHRDELVHHGLEVGALAVRRLARALVGRAILREIAGDDADRVEADARAVEVEASGLDRLLEIAADPGIGDGALGVGDRQMIERLLDPLRAVVGGVVVGEREQVEAEIDEGLHRGRMAPEVERRILVALPSSRA